MIEQKSKEKFAEWCSAKRLEEEERKNKEKQERKTKVCGYAVCCVFECIHVSFVVYTTVCVCMFCLQNRLKKSAYVMCKLCNIVISMVFVLYA